MIRKLKDVMPIKRTKMLLRIHFHPNSKLSHSLINSFFLLSRINYFLFYFPDELPMRSSLAKAGAQVLPSPAATADSTEMSLDFDLEPDAYRAVEALVKSLAAGKLQCLYILLCIHCDTLLSL